MGSVYNADGEPSPLSSPLGPLSESPDFESGFQKLSLQTDQSMRSSANSISSVGYDTLSRSPLFDNEHGLGPSGLDRIRQQPSRVLTLPNMSTSSLAPSTSGPRHTPTMRSNSSSRAPTGHMPLSQNFGDLEDLHRFPLESLHSFSFAQQSEELLQTRQNILKRSIDFMRDRMGWAASNPAIVNAQANATGDSEIQSMVDLLTRAHVLDEDLSKQFHGPITGPAEINGDNIFEKTFSEHSTSPVSSRDMERDTSRLSIPSLPGSQATSDSSQLLSPVNERIPSSRSDLLSAPSSRRVSLKRTYTDLNSASIKNKLMDTLAQPYSSSGDPIGSLSSSTTGLGLPSALHTHSSKWTPHPQAVFRTEAQAPWTIIAANDLSCLVFGVTQSEVRHLSILEVVQKEHRGWLEAKLRDPSTDAAARAPLQPERPNIRAVNPKFRGLGNGVTAQLLNKPSSREKASRRAQTDDGYGSSTRNARNPNHPANKSRGVLICGDVVPIQKRDGAKGSASVWVMEKRGGLIWVLEEITENIAILHCDPSWNVVDAHGDIDKIWGALCHPQGPSHHRVIASFALRYFAAKTAAGVCIPVAVGKGENANTLQVSSFPHVAGMMVISSASLNVISSNSVFSSALFGQERPEGRNINELIPEFDEFLDVLTEEDNVPLVDGIVIPEHSFRRARTLSILRDGKANAASVFTEPSGLLARHRDGSTIVVDVQLRVVKSGTFFSKEQAEKLEGRSSDSEDSDDTVAVTELVYALWVTYSRQLHAAGPATLSSSIPTSKPNSPSPAPGGDPDLTSADAVDTRGSSVEIQAPSSSLSQQLSEAASEPLTDKPAQAMAEVKPGEAKEPPQKRTINDYVIMEEMGQGAYGQVKLARLKKTPSKKMVLKYVTKRRILVDTWTRDRKLGTVPLEIHVLDFLRRDGYKHPNIVEMEGFFEDDINYYIEMVPHGLPGMDLFDYIELRANMDEAECRNIFKQVVDAIHHLHTKALVVHRDIKDENVVLDGEGRIKLIDFGSAAYIRNGPFDVFITPPPKFSRADHTAAKSKTSGPWVFLLYTIVYKENPFYNVDEILDHPIRIPFLPFSEECIDLIRKMLDRDVDSRLTITEVLEHPWMIAEVEE
ncbi:hypothetical protein N7470_000974 [Penicillium chermesinum]|nr:hypothetical protein N7470_000974 [Penicillium chermesinum]